MKDINNEYYRIVITIKKDALPSIPENSFFEKFDDGSYGFIGEGCKCEEENGDLTWDFPTIKFEIGGIFINAWGGINEKYANLDLTFFPYSSISYIALETMITNCNREEEMKDKLKRDENKNG